MFDPNTPHRDDGIDRPKHVGDRRELTAFERVIASLSARFINLPADRVNDAFRESLREIVLFMGIDRSSVSRFAPDSAFYRTDHSWAVPGVTPLAHGNSTRHFPWVYEMAMARIPIVFSRLDDLPPAASVDRESYRQLGLRSHIGQPIVVAGRLYGVLGFGCLRRDRTWSQDDLERARLLADIFAHALARVAAQEELDRAVGFERLASSILASLVVTPTGNELETVAQSLERIGAFMKAQRVTLWDRVQGTPTFERAAAWQASWLPGLEELKTPSPTWIGSQLCAGRVVRFCEIDDLPETAADDFLPLRAAQIRSLLAVPVSLRGEVVGAFAISTITEAKEWPEGVVSGARLLAEVFATLRERQAMEHRKQAAEVEAALWRERLAHLVRVHTAGEMSVALAHEITQPLGAIENYALAAKRRASDPNPDMTRVVDLIDKIVGQATRAGDVVSRMRSMVQRHELVSKEIDLMQVVAGCVDMVRIDCELREIRLVVHANTRDTVVVADEIHLQQVVLNLLRNAMQALDGLPDLAAKEIRVDVDSSGADDVAVQVADRGPGIADTELERVFESFYSTKAEGLGVGLAICRRLIEAHGGQLKAAHNPGGGAVFRFTLPVGTRAA